MTSPRDDGTTEIGQIDIAERLAFYAREMPKGGAYSTAEIMAEACREIERLRADREAILAFLESNYAGSFEADELAGMIRNGEHLS